MTAESGVPRAGPGPIGPRCGRGRARRTSPPPQPPPRSGRTHRSSSRAPFDRPSGLRRERRGCRRARLPVPESIPREGPRRNSRIGTRRLKTGSVVRSDRPEATTLSMVSAAVKRTSERPGYGSATVLAYHVPSGPTSGNGPSLRRALAPFSSRRVPRSKTMWEGGVRGPSALLTEKFRDPSCAPVAKPLRPWRRRRVPSRRAR